MQKKIAVVDYGMGNLGSVKMAFKKLGVNISSYNDIDQLECADAYILPGVGAFPQAITNLKKYGIYDFLNEQILEKKKPILGICLGMQLMADQSFEQGNTKGFGWVSGAVTPIKPSSNLHVPHVGWNNLHIKNQDIIFKNIDNDSHFFYDQSFRFEVKNENLILGFCDYGGKIVSVIRQSNIFGTQFHPEKSQRNGLKMLRNFINYVNQ